MTSPRALAYSLSSLVFVMLSACTGAVVTHADAGVPDVTDPNPPELMEPVRPDQVCPTAKRLLAESLARLDHTCAADADCVLVDVQLEPCRIPVAFPAKVSAIAAAHQDVVRDTRAICGIPHPPCPAPLAHAVCDAGRCLAREGMAPPVVPAWEGLLSSEQGPIANTDVKAALFVQPHCATAPCNAMNAGEMSLRTDARGVVRVSLGGGTDTRKISMADPDYAMLTVAGFEEQRVNLGPTAAPVPIRLRVK